MKRQFSLLIIFFLAVSTSVWGQKTIKDIQSFNSIHDHLRVFDPSATQIGGYLGTKISLVIERRIKAEEPSYLVEPFRHKEETRLWQTEFWGKWMLSAAAAYNYTHDSGIMSLMEKGVKELLGTQMPDGYIGNYSDSAQLKQWDIWGQKYTMLGLLAYYDITGDRSALDGAARMADHLMTLVGPGKADIVKTGNYRGMPSSSVLEPIVYLYRHTGNKRYLEFAEYIVSQWETPGGPKLISKALEGVPVAERYPHPEVWWSYENGQKAYEMMSCYDGLLDLYRITGNPDYINAVRMTVSNIIKDEINIAGSGTAFECFYKGAEYQTRPTYHTMETCVTMTWMKLCFNLLKLTGDPLYADQIEKSAYNAMLASLKDDGSEIAKYSPLGGVRHEGEKQCGMDINCCVANGPRAFVMLPSFAVMGFDNDLCINLYGTLKSGITTGGGHRVIVSQESDYPVTGREVINIDPSEAVVFPLALRIPAWSTLTRISVNDSVITEITPGEYKTIRRRWKRGDSIVLELDLRGRLYQQDGQQALLHGPVVLARDTRFNDGALSEAAVVQSKGEELILAPDPDRPSGVWMAFTCPVVLGTDLEGPGGKPRAVHFCDFASAGNTWGEDSRYAVWLPRTLNAMGTDYKGY
ncbi:MAG TPA: beta-L-arabinofuranosidase domain-containing protein [Bacteroidales bacterium]|nr:beta-L-arabinofuranosidase domain-containing protein [Bacteroidales bacterium]